MQTVITVIIIGVVCFIGYRAWRRVCRWAEQDAEDEAGK